MVKLELFVRHFGQHDVVHLSAFALDANDKVVQASAFADALTQLLANLDQATAPEHP